MSCEDICSMSAKCQYWTSYGRGINCCHFFSGEKTPILQQVSDEELKAILPSRCTELPVSGVRKHENFSAYLGGMVSVPYHSKKPPVVQRSECRQQAHAANSPLSLTVLPPLESASSPMAESVPESVSPTNAALQVLDICSAGEVLTPGAGRWQAFDASVCHNDSSFELDEIKMMTNTLLDSAVINGIKYAMFQNHASLAVYYTVTHSTGKTEYSFRVPREWFPEQSLTPPWQLVPRCTLGPVAVPPSTMDMKGVITRVISFAYVRDALTGYEYVSPANCRFHHFSRGQIRKCLNLNNISAIISSGKLRIVYQDVVCGEYSNTFLSMCLFIVFCCR